MLYQNKKRRSKMETQNNEGIKEAVSNFSHLENVDSRGNPILGGVKVRIISGRAKGHKGYVYQQRGDEIMVTSEPQTGGIGWFSGDELEVYGESLKSEIRKIETFLKEADSAGNRPKQLPKPGHQWHWTGKTWDQVLGNRQKAPEKPQGKSQGGGEPQGESQGGEKPNKKELEKKFKAQVDEAEKKWHQAWDKYRKLNNELTEIRRKHLYRWNTAEIWGDLMEEVRKEMKEELKEGVKP